jgi:dTDP-4-dehydrorhamnose reductase
MIVVFGGNGQLGHELARTAAATGTRLAALARSTVDIADADAVARTLEEFRPGLVVNAAAYTKVDLAERDIEAAERSNRLGARVLARACAETGIPLVHMSTDYVFDGRKSAAYVEDDPIAPLGVYARTKAAGEEEVRQALGRHVILRTSWVYGEFGTNFLKTVLRLAQQRDELRIVADQRGCPSSTRELAAAILRVAPRLIAGEPVWGTYHFAGSGETTWHGFATHVVAAQAPLTGRRPAILPITTADYPTPARRPANSVLDCSRFASVFGFRARWWTDEAEEITISVVRTQQGSTVEHVA